MQDLSGVSPLPRKEALDFSFEVFGRRGLWDLGVRTALNCMNAHPDSLWNYACNSEISILMFARLINMYLPLNQHCCCSTGFLYSQLSASCLSKRILLVLHSLRRQESEAAEQSKFRATACYHHWPFVLKGLKPRFAHSHLIVVTIGSSSNWKRENDWA